MKPLCLGAHMSVAGGIDRAVDRIAAIGGCALQLFTSSSNQWHAREIPDAEAEAFRDKRRRHGVRFAFAHDSYLINAGSPDDALWKRSVKALTGEMRRAEWLGLDYVVMHPGAHVGSGEAAAFGRIAEALDAVGEAHPKAKARLCLEVTAGQGTSVGYRFSHLGEILKRVQAPDRVGVCIDTCHLLAAGYELRTRAGYEATMAELDREVGIDKVWCFHLNDSKEDLASRVDRHEHIGRGCLGLDPFRFLLADARFAGLPMVLETPKGEDLTEDRENLEVLRSLVA